MGDATAVIALSRNPRLPIVASHGQGEQQRRIVAAADSPTGRPPGPWRVIAMS